jgi:hypothetical protein
VAEGAHETSTEEVVEAAAPSSRAAIGEAGFSPEAPLTASSLLSLQRRAGNRAASALVARQAADRRLLQRAGGLSPQQVNFVLKAWTDSIVKARNAGVGSDLSAIDNAARAKTKTQVGDANYARFVEWENNRYDAMYASAKQKEKEKEAPPLDMESAQRARYEQMWRDTAAIRAEVTQTEYLCQKLNFGHGAKGGAARVTAGAYTGMYAVGARGFAAVANHVPMMVVSTVGLNIAPEKAAKFGIKHAKEMAQEGTEIMDDIGTAKELVGGEFQAAYDATRAPYAKYMAAFSSFTNASTQFLKDQQLDGVTGFVACGKDLGEMDTYQRQMRDAGAEYAIACARLGIQSSAKRVDTLGKHIVKGSEDMVEQAVMLGVTEVAPGFGELKSAVKGMKGMGPKQLEKMAAEAVEKSLVKEAEGTAMKVGEEAVVKTGMPVKNQEAIAEVCKAHDVSIEVRGTNPEAPRQLAEGALPKPEAIKAKTINELDTYLGFRPEDKGLVGYMKPKKPEGVPAHLAEAVEARYQQRLAEFNDLSGEMSNLALPPGARDKFAAVGFDKQVRVDSNGVVRVVGEAGERPVGFTGDHDLWQIRNPDGTPVSAEKYNEIVSELVRKKVGVEHGAHMHWDVPAKPVDPHFKDATKGFQGIADKHMPGAKGGEDLFRFNPDGTITPVRADAGKDTLGAARAAGKADKGAAVGDIDKTVGAIGQ